MSDSVIDIPNEAGWPERTLERMCSTISRGTAPVYVEHSDVLAIGQRCVTTLGFAPAFARPHSSRAMSNVLKPEVGDVLLNSTGTGTIGRSCVFDSSKDFIVDGHVTLLRSAPDQFRGEWLDAVLRSSWAQNHLERFCYAGSTNQIELSRTELAATSLPVPSIDEQNDFVRIFRTLDSAIRKTEAIVEKLKQVKQGLLHDLLTRGMDANGELRPSYEEAPDLYQQSPLGWIPREWALTQVGCEANIEHGFAFSGTLFTSEPIGPTLLVPGNFHRDGGLYFTDQNTKYFSGKYPAHTILTNGDVLIVMTDLSPMTLILGRTVVLDEKFHVLHNQRIGKFAFKDRGAWDPSFFASLMSDDRLRMKIIAEATGTTVRHTSPDRIKSCHIPRPSFDEQKCISSRLKAVGDRTQTEQCKLAKLQSQKKGLMDDLLTGRVRVTPLLAK